MPAAVPVVATVLGVSSAVATVIVVGAAVVGTVVAAKAVGSALSGALSPDIPDYDGSQGSASDQARGVLLTKRGTNVDIPVIYGYRRVGGRIIFADTNGTDNQYLYVVYAISEGEISKVKRIFVDDAELPTRILHSKQDTQCLRADSKADWSSNCLPAQKHKNNPYWPMKQNLGPTNKENYQEWPMQCSDSNGRR